MRVVLALAFRPFFLVAAPYAALAVIVWGAHQFALTRIPSYFPGHAWHAHEMLFGFVAAVLAGFLLTASRNWAKTRGIHGPELGLLLLLWLSGRVAIFASSWIPAGLVAVLDLAFLPTLAALLARTLAKGGHKKNFVFVFWLAVFFAANVLMHLEVLGLAGNTLRRGYLLGMDCIVMVMVVIGGRVIPMFTQNSLPDVRVRKLAALEFVTLVVTTLYVVSDFVDESSVLTAVTALIAGAASLVRLALWRPTRTLAMPVLWVLHLGYLFLALGLVARGLSLGFVSMPGSLAIHLLTAGAMGILVVGMMSRVAMGHTGRKIVASRATVMAYGLVIAGVLVRVLVPLFARGHDYLGGIFFSACLWGLGFFLYFFEYWPVLTRPRVDGREG